MTLSNRDISSLVWLVAFAAFVLSKPAVRSSVRELLRAFFGKIAVLVALYWAYLAAVVAIAFSAGLWNFGLLKDTIVWAAVPGLAPLFGFSEAAKERGFYRRAMVRAVSLTALIEFYLNLAAFPLLVELVLVPVAVLLAMMSAVVDLRPEYATVKRWVDRLAALVGLAVLGGTAVTLASGQIKLDAHTLVLQFGVPVWLTVASVPFVFVFSLYANYESQFIRIDLQTKDDPRARRRAKLALLTTYGIHNHELAAFVGAAYGDLARAKSWREARQIVAYRRAEARVEEARRDLAASRLARYQGVEGTDWDGRPYDEREFEETKKALEFLAGVHRARYENGRYRKDLMDLVKGIVSRTRPDEEFVMTVSKDARSWFACRRTIGGWYLGIGAAGRPTEDWTYLGTRAPHSFPTLNSGWTHGEFALAVEVDE